MSEITHKPFKPTHYEVLDLPMGADEGEIRRAYERIRQIYAEDSLAVYGLYSPEEIREVREQIEQAFRVLIDPENRRAYEQTLASEPVKPKRQLQLTIRSREEEDSALAGKNTETQAHSADHRSQSVGESLPPAPTPAFRRGEIDVADDAVFTGAFLKQLREAHNIDLRDISETTKVSIGNLRMIEDETWDRLPALVYVKGFIVQYAKYLGIDEKRVLADLIAQIEASGALQKD